MTDKIYHVALIGCGHMGEAHIEDIYYKDNVRIEYVCDLDISRALSFSKRFGARKITDNYLDCIQDVEVDIVIIATYPSTHLPIVKECITNNKHIICEKPIAASAEQGREFASLVKSNPQCKVLIGHILRHNKTYQKAAEMIRSGAIGFPVIMRMVQNHHTMDWDKYLKLISETSPIIDCGVHYIDVMEWFTGSRITHIDATGIRTEGDVPADKYNYGIMTVTLQDGSIGYYEAGWSNTIAADNLKEFIGPKGRISLIYRKDRHTHQEEGDLIEYYRYPEKVYESINIQSKRKATGIQFDYLVDMIENGTEGTPTMDEVLRSLQIAIEADMKIKDKLAVPGR
ncbi:MAG: Gfo/Idh/MocA family protein [Saccharofermentanales bacterium]